MPLVAAQIGQDKEIRAPSPGQYPGQPSCCRKYLIPYEMNTFKISLTGGA
jgi:hypothetical protein